MFLILSVSVSGIAQAPDIKAQSWEEVKKNGRGFITVYWYESRPFIFRTPLGMSGIEYDLLEGFRKFLKDKHNVDLQIMWKEARSFGDTYELIADYQREGTFGVSAFSITPDRLQQVGFSPPYMSDISVLITSKNIPIVQSSAEFNRVFSKLRAITIKSTTYEQDIFRLREQGSMDFDIEYIPSSENILTAIEERDSAFGFIDLPVYMMIFNENPSVNVKRQNFFPVKRKGYAIIYPKKSDWRDPVNEYFNSDGFESTLETIIGKYIDISLYDFVETLAIQSNDLVALLTKEKEIQYKDLLGKSQQIAKDNRTMNFLIVLLSVIIVFLVVIVVQYRKRSQQQRKIESQRQSIELQNEQLAKRNHHLVTLDEEKNNLIKILAHDLRTPINHMQGLAQVFLVSNEDLPEDQRMIIQKITDASMRLNRMITNILDIDSIENNRVKIFMDDVHIVSLVGQVIKSFEKQAARKNIQLADLSTATSSIIKGDSLFLIQVFENLISNALKFSPKESRVEVSVREHGDKVHVKIRDYGPGLTDEDKSLLFKKFQRLSAKPTDGENSTGLGLSIVKKYVELMNGKVWCESQSGQGASFIVEFQSVAYKVSSESNSPVQPV